MLFVFLFLFLLPLLFVYYFLLLGWLGGVLGLSWIWFGVFFCLFLSNSNNLLFLLFFLNSCFFCLDIILLHSYFLINLFFLGLNFNIFFYSVFSLQIGLLLFQLFVDIFGLLFLFITYNLHLCLFGNLLMLVWDIFYYDWLRRYLCLIFFIFFGIFFIKLWLNPLFFVLGIDTVNVRCFIFGFIPNHVGFIEEVISKKYRDSNDKYDDPSVALFFISISGRISIIKSNFFKLVFRAINFSHIVI